MEQTFSDTILQKRTTHPEISAESNQTPLQKNCPAESGNNWTESCRMPVEERQTFEKTQLIPRRTKSAAKSFLTFIVVTKRCLQVATSRTVTEFTRAVNSVNRSESQKHACFDHARTDHTKPLKGRRRILNLGTNVTKTK